MEEFNILETLFSNPGLCHVAEHVISYLDDKSVAQYRLVSKQSCQFLVNIWRDRMLTEGKRLCQKKFTVYEIESPECDRRYPRPRIETCIFELWPDWKNALLEITSLENLNVVIYLLQQYFIPSPCTVGKMIQTKRSLHMGLRRSPLHFAARHISSLLSQKVFKVLLETSLDFNVCIYTSRTPFHEVCQHGSKEVVELILDNAVKKGINVTAGTCDDTCSQYPVGKAIRNTNDPHIVKLLFERRKEFDFHLCYNNLELALKNTDPFDLWSERNGVETFEMVLKWSIEKGVPVDTVKTVNTEDGSEAQAGLLNRACEYSLAAALIILQSHEKYGLDKSVLASMALTPALNLKYGNDGYKLPIESAKRSIAVLVKLRSFSKKAFLENEGIIKEIKLLGQKLIHELEKYSLYAFDMDQE